MNVPRPITQHIHYGLMPLLLTPFGAIAPYGRNVVYDRNDIRKFASLISVYRGGGLSINL